MLENRECIHCGEDCGRYPVMWKGTPFCCEGCKTVFQLLDTNRLGQYYRIAKMPGIKIGQEDIAGSEKFAFLDLDEIRTKLLDFSSSGISRVRFFIPSIHCASCIWLLENLNKLNPAIIQSQVNFPRKQVSITFREHEITLRKIVEILASVHYVPEINQQSIDRGKYDLANRKLLIKIGIAGFGFLNAMMYHFPGYLPGSEFLDPSLKGLFGWLSFALAIPVVFYCADDYFFSAVKALRKKTISIDLPIALGLITLFLQSLSEIVYGKGPGYIDSLNGLVFFLLIGKFYQGKTYQALSFERDYKSYFPLAVTAVSNGVSAAMPVGQLRPGNRILIRNREIIPADSRVVKGEASIDYSFVTGESLPVRIENGGFIYAGGRQSGGSIELVVEKEVEQSYLTQLWNQSNKRDNEEAQLKNIINRVSQFFTLAVIAMAIGAGIYWLAADRIKALFAFTSVLIIACPCALALTIPFTFGSTLRQFGRRGFYLKNTGVIEKLLRITTVVFDKTGTLTHTRTSAVTFYGTELLREEKIMVKSLASQSTHPMSRIISENLPGDEMVKVENFEELPSLGVAGIVNGVNITMGSYFFLTGKVVNGETLSTQVWLSIGKEVRGYFEIGNKYREGLEEITNDLKKSFDLHLISGDNDAEKKNLAPLFHQVSNLKFNQSPTDKLEYVKRLQQQGNRVLMIGDGLNDAGALAESNVGIVIADDIYNFSPACDAILQSGRFKDLSRFIRFTRVSRMIVFLSFAISFIYNLAGLFFAVQGNLSPIIAAILMPMSSVSVVAFATFSVAFAASKGKI